MFEKGNEWYWNVLCSLYTYCVSRDLVTFGVRFTLRVYASKSLELEKGAPQKYGNV